MIPWAAFERRWLEALAGAMIPGLAELEPALFFDEMRAAAPPMLALGMRTSVWILAFSPPILLGKLSTFSGLGADDRDLLLTRAASSRSYFLRQLVLVIKLAACFAYFRDARVRSKFVRADA